MEFLPHFILRFTYTTNVQDYKHIMVNQANVPYTGNTSEKPSIYTHFKEKHYGTEPAF
jgi:hypothetical protein